MADSLRLAAPCCTLELPLARPSRNRHRADIQRGGKKREAQPKSFFSLGALLAGLASRLRHAMLSEVIADVFCIDSQEDRCLALLAFGPGEGLLDQPPLEGVHATANV